MSDLYEYQAIDGSSKGPVDLVLLLRARNLGRLSNRTLVRKVPGGDWRPLASFIPSMTVMDDDGEPSVLPDPGSEPGGTDSGWSRKKYWIRVIKAWCRFEGRAGKGELHEVFPEWGLRGWPWRESPLLRNAVCSRPWFRGLSWFPLCCTWCSPCCLFRWRLPWSGVCMMSGGAAFSWFFWPFPS